MKLEIHDKEISSFFFNHNYQVIFFLSSLFINLSIILDNIFGKINTRLLFMYSIGLDRYPENCIAFVLYQRFGCSFMHLISLRRCWNILWIERFVYDCNHLNIDEISFIMIYN
jgi:hypothetical protein